MKVRGVRQRIIIDGLEVENLHTFHMLALAELHAGEVRPTHYRRPGGHLVVVERWVEEIDVHGDDCSCDDCNPYPGDVL